MIKSHFSDTICGVKKHKEAPLHIALKMQQGR